MSLRRSLEDQATELFSQSIVTDERLTNREDLDHTALDRTGPNDARRVAGDATAIDPPFSGTPTSLAAVGALSSGEITAQSVRAPEPTAPPTAQPASDPTSSTRLGSAFIQLVAGTLVGDFVIDKLLGSGGMGAVYGGRHERLGKRVAIKVISPSLSMDTNAVERFEQEAEVLARLSHPNIVSVMSVGTLPGDGRSYYVMEFLNGEPLQARIDRGRIPLDDALDIVAQVARGLEAAHVEGIIHRDLKPDNVWLQVLAGEARPNVKILDLGLAKLSQHRRSENTASNVMFGTPQYMSPEQCQSSRDVGPPTDVYALGCIMFELLCGRRPFAYDNMAELTVAHQTEDPPHPRDFDSTIDRQLDALVVAMLAKDPRQRPTIAVLRSTIADTRKRILVEVSHVHEQTSPSTTTPPQFAASISPGSRSRRRAVALSAASVLLVVSLFVAKAAMSGHDDHPAEPSAVPRSDTTLESLPVPPADTPTRAVLPVDAGVAAERQRARRQEARPSVAPPSVAPPSVAQEHLDAGPEVVADADTTTAVVEIDARAEPAVVPGTKAPELQVRPRPPPSETKKPGLGRNQTFNPFTKKPASR